MRNVTRLLLIALIFTFILPLTAFAAETDAPLDYSQEANWVDIQKWGAKSVDLFFIYPTVVMETENEDGFASVSEMRSMANAVRKNIASTYDASCNVYMPFYRQASMNLADSCNNDNTAYMNLLHNGKSYTDIVAALDYYFENYNNGKPFVLAGHSQGSALLLNVLTDYMQEHKDYLSRMVAAYSIGFAPSEDIFNENTGLKFATRADDYNVVVSFTTEGPTATGKSVLLPENPMVINPLTWTTDDAYGSVDMNKGFANVSAAPDCVTVEPGMDDAQINLTRKTLVCTTRVPDDEPIAPESFHTKESYMYYGNLRENVQVRIDAYFADH